MENILQNKYYIIINPNAGDGESLKKWEKIESKLLQLEFNFAFGFTEEPGHSIDIVHQKIKEGYRKFVCVGGDGTLNELVNAFFTQNIVNPNDITLGLIPMGTGNDWRRYFNIPSNFMQALEILTKEKVFKQDVGKIIYYKKNGEKASAYFLNIAGLGFDSVVVKTTNKLKVRGSRDKMTYLRGIILSLWNYKYWDIEIISEQRNFKGKILSVSIGNGKYSGSGMIQTPNAIIDDGLLDITVYTKINKFKVLANIHNLFNGKILNIKGIFAFRTNKLSIKSSHEIFAEVDGELIGNGPYEIEVLPKALNVIVQ